MLLLIQYTQRDGYFTGFPVARKNRSLSVAARKFGKAERLVLQFGRFLLGASIARRAKTEQPRPESIRAWEQHIIMKSP